MEESTTSVLTAARSSNCFSLLIFLASTRTTRKECSPEKCHHGTSFDSCHSEPIDQDRCNFVSTIWRPSRTWHRLPQMGHTMFLVARLLSFDKQATRIRIGTRGEGVVH